MTLSIIGGIQPGRLRPLVEDAANAGGGDDGLLQRFQLFVWPDQLETWRRADRWPDGPARDRARSIYERLDRVIPSDVDATRDRDDGIPYTSFTPNAQIIADHWHDQLEHRLRTGELDATPAFASHISKYRSLMPSLALLFHLVDVADGKVSPGPVGEAPTRLAADWCEFLELHARKLYDVELDKGKSAARALAAKIKNGAIIDGKAVREIYRSQWSGLTTDDIVFDGLNVLQSLGWVRIESISSGGRASQIVRLHPGLQREQGHE
jgi:putative DNA primase/helicase